jgi:peroxiredoxin
MGRILLKKLLLPLLGAGLLIGLWLVLGNPDQAPQASFTTIEGKQIALSDLKGHAVLVNFWATSCPGCIIEMPKLVQSYKQYQAKGFEVIAVAMAYDPPNHVVNYAKKNGLPFPVAFDTDGALATAFDVQVTPTSIIIDQHGKIVQRIIGEIDFTTLHALLDEKLGRKAS